MLLSFRASRKIILSFILLILLPVSVLTYYSYHSSIDIIQKEVLDTKLLALRQLEINLSFHFNNIRNVSDMLFMNSNLQTILSDTSRKGIVEQLTEMRQLDNIINSAQDNEDVYKVRLFINSSKIYVRQRINYYPIDWIRQYDWYENILDMYGNLYYKSTYLENYLFNNSSYVVSCARVLWDQNNLHHMAGILVIDTEEKSLNKLISNVQFARSENIYIIDRDGLVVSNIDQSKLGQPAFGKEKKARIFSSDEAVIQVGKGKETRFIIHKTIGANGWKVAAVIPASDILREYKSFNTIISFLLTTFLIILFLFTVSVIAAVMAERLTTRIKNLTRDIETVGIEHYNREARKNKDIDRLEHSIHTMLNTVKRLVEESYQAKVHEKEAQLYALQAQINPHFLYNTLDTINWMAIRQGTTDISLLVDSLAKYFRMVLAKGKDIVTIQEEVNLVKVYLDIQRARFGDNYQVIFHIGKELEEYAIPKFTLQPIIENALEHGIQKRKDRKGTITITAEKTDDHIRFTITDDGIGMSPEAIDKILDPPEDSQRKGYGLYNVHQRLILFSGNGETCGLKIQSRENAGTAVTITLKAKMQRA